MLASQRNAAEESSEMLVLDIEVSLFDIVRALRLIIAFGRTEYYTNIATMSKGTLLEIIRNPVQTEVAQTLNPKPRANQPSFGQGSE